MTKANWHMDLARGDQGERDFLNTFPSYRKVDDSQMYECDFQCIHTDETVELKTDYYDMNKTPNIIVERYSNQQKGTPGGPYRHSDQLTYWVYYYKQNGLFLFYNALQLIEVVDSLGLPIIPIQNQGYTTGVYKVPRDKLTSCIHFTVSISNK